MDHEEGMLCEEGDEALADGAGRAQDADLVLPLVHLVHHVGCVEEKAR